MVVTLLTNLFTSEIGRTSVTFPMDPLTRNLTDEILSSGATWKREVGDVVLLLLTGNLVTNLLLALAFILRFLDTNREDRVSSKFPLNTHNSSDNTQGSGKLTDSLGISCTSCANTRNRLYRHQYK